ncbi:MAG TPA: hypothetical protein VGK20_05540 [Candidatus Binatia bacterium]|jgi:hypothetical protein
MQRVKLRLVAATVLTIAAWPAAAPGQVPVCPQPDPERPMISACAAGGRYAVAAFLNNLSIDQTLRGEGAPILRDLHSVFATSAPQGFQKQNAEVGDYLGHLPPLRLSRFDTASGSVEMAVPDDSRTAQFELQAGGHDLKLGIELPERIEGGYWRTPGVLQVAFWSGRRAKFHTQLTDGSAFDAEIACLVVSGDGIRIVTTGDDTPDVLVRMDACP